MNKKVAVILSGCGVYDGSEIYESVITLLRLDQRGVKVQCFAPNIAQMHVINHLTGEEMPESRNVLTESARLARGEIKDLREARAEDFDALIMPGGFGAAKNLSTFATEGANSKALPDVVALVKAFAEARKPVGMMCIAPTMAAEIFGAGVVCTLGSDDADAAKAVGQMGASHQACEVSDIVVDKQHRLVTTPAYMLAQSISEAASGIYKLVDRVLEMTTED
ncbi:MAG: isoprenoid biosynthesis glyoxalase ElbB [Pseudomonas sp.]|uniref:isoprenoid biosynthesis glyoxalase ElbB n=1 Tax=Stutzerimonas frequens TaxID=2968969 RepID=UPI000D7EA9CE|nr:isoprenoid biosynthesis glyoxalase ElbB [Stutzerimonas frequens]MBA4725738.1 isoprenoid biosynthesis glyoxalase ElbB [Pseudomonas sp.]MEC7473535.1 isoprenoid biosynthesis glyoxalase ElbB [Pseudomonadota bacterium]RRV68135.1 isoprenoid biosynthesis protein ElbB [Stutzerimonas stutzeri]AWT11596.1 isoprenoid biosynthesis protein ElbB [Stutzerimonas frequens]MBK3918470.1 isoprenoid biosynthesis glyoxalase ElbB [Stutzerimonas frequens]